MLLKEPNSSPVQIQQVKYISKNTQYQHPSRPEIWADAQRHTKDTKYRGEALVQARESLFRELMANHFLKYFWKTLFLRNCARVSDLDMMRFVMYDLLKRNFCKQPTPSALEAFVAGAVAKSFATGTTYPLQVAQSPRCIIYIFLHSPFHARLFDFWNLCNSTDVLLRLPLFLRKDSTAHPPHQRSFHGHSGLFVGSDCRQRFFAKNCRENLLQEFTLLCIILSVEGSYRFDIIGRFWEHLLHHFYLRPG